MICVFMIGPLGIMGYVSLLTRGVNGGVNWAADLNLGSYVAFLFDRNLDDSLSFNDLKQLMNTTDGNLSVHARKLEEANYVTCNKSFEGRVPKTRYALTPLGRRALERYLDHMEALIDAARDR